MKNCTLTVALITAGIAVVSSNAEDQTGGKTLSKAEITKKFDRNGDGTLDYREKMTFLRSLDENGKAAYRRAFFSDNQQKNAQNSSRETVERTHSSKAPNSRPARPNVPRGTAASTGASPLAIFMANDRNKDGKISVKEAPERMTSGIGFTKIDTNRDGFIDKNEFMALHSKITSRAGGNDRRDSSQSSPSRRPSSQSDDARKAWAERMKKYQEARAKAARPSHSSRSSHAQSSPHRRPSGDDIRKAIAERIKQYAEARKRMSQQHSGHHGHGRSQQSHGRSLPQGIVQARFRMAQAQGPNSGKAGVCPHCKRGPSPQAKHAPQRGPRHGAPQHRGSHPQRGPKGPGAHHGPQRGGPRGPQHHGPQRGGDRRPQFHGPQRGGPRGPQHHGPQRGGSRGHHGPRGR